jgi:hypothetical protein
MTVIAHFAHWETPSDFDRRLNSEWPILRRGDGSVATRHGDGWAVFDRDGNAIGMGATNSEAWLSVRAGRG